MNEDNSFEHEMENVFADNDILNKNGMLIIGVDHYLENPNSLNWGKEFNLDITTLSISEW